MDINNSTKHSEDPLKVRITSEAWEQDESLELSPGCDLAGLREAINGLNHGTSGCHLFCDETDLNGYEDHTKLADLELTDDGYIDINVVYPTAALRDITNPQHPVKISSDQTRRIILPIRGKRAGSNFTYRVCNDETELTLTSKGKDMILYIENPDVAREPGKHFTLGFLLPRSTRKVAIESIPPLNPPTVTEAAPPLSRFKLNIHMVPNSNWTTNYQSSQSHMSSAEKTVEFEVGNCNQRIFLEAQNTSSGFWKKANIIVASSFGGVGAGAGVGALTGPGIIIGSVVGGVIGTVVGVGAALSS